MPGPRVGLSARPCSPSAPVPPRVGCPWVRHSAPPGTQRGEPGRSGPDGQYELSATADANGTVHVCLRASHPQTVTVEVLGENRHVVRDVTIGVLGVGGSLPNTGVPMWSMIGAAMLLLAAGGALVFGVRRKHAH